MNTGYMWRGKLGRVVESVMNRISSVFVGFAAVVLALMMFLTTADVGGRVLIKSPIKGTMEITQLAMALVVFGGLAYTEVKDGHIQIDVLTCKLPRKAQLVISSVILPVSAAMMVLISWETILSAQTWMESGYITATLGIPMAPFGFVAGALGMLFGMVLIMKAAHSIAQAKAWFVDRFIEAGYRVVQVREG